MKNFMQKGFIRKLIISIICVILLNFCFAPNVQAKYGGEMTVLMREFATAIADVAATVVQLGVTGEWSSAVAKKGSGSPDGSDYWIRQSNFQYPILQVSPELIFAGEIELLDVNFIAPINSRDYTIELKNDNGLAKLRDIVAGWYVTLRTIAIVGLLSVLIYIGIRIIISSTSGEKAKYKERLLDWIIAFCLLFFMHYIMAAAITVVERVNNMLGHGTGVFDGIAINPEYGTVQFENNGYIGTGAQGGGSNYNGVNQSDITGIEDDEAINTVKSLANADGANVISESGWTEPIINRVQAAGIEEKISTYEIIFDIYTVKITRKEITPLVSGASGYVSYSYKTSNISTSGGSGGNGLVGTNVVRVSDDSSKVLYFINYARLFLNVKDDDQYIPMSIAYLIIYIALVVFTAVFAIRYIKRVIYIAFLTMIAPMVALTYPLDKLKDRKSTSLEYVV